MESITNAAATAATTASKLIWGEQNNPQGNETAGQEPISGYQGKGTVEEPYDQGNAENPTTPAGKQDLTSDNSTFEKEHSSNPTTSAGKQDLTSDNPTFEKEHSSNPFTIPSMQESTSNDSTFNTEQQSNPFTSAGKQGLSNDMNFDSERKSNPFTSSGMQEFSANDLGFNNEQKTNPFASTSNQDFTSNESTFSTEQNRNPFTSAGKQEDSAFNTENNTNPFTSNDSAFNTENNTNPFTSNDSAFNNEQKSNPFTPSGTQDLSSNDSAFDNEQKSNPFTPSVTQDLSSNYSTFQDEHTSNANKMETGNSFSNTENTSSHMPSTNDITERAPINPNNAMAGGVPRPEHETDKTGVIGNMSKSTYGSDVVPTERSVNPGGAPSSTEQFEQKQQGPDRPGESPTGEQVSTIKEKKDDAEAVLKEHDPNDHSGEPMKMHGASEIPKTQEERRDSKIGMPGGQEHGKEPKGTGEQWVKTTGFAADHGDFDATKPGAAKEADRLLSDKGIHHDEKGNMDSVPEPTGADHKDKVPLSEKIKTKLHIGSHKDK